MTTKRNPYVEAAAWAFIIGSTAWQGFAGFLIAFFGICVGGIGTLLNRAYDLKHGSTRDRRGF